MCGFAVPGWPAGLGRSGRYEVLYAQGHFVHHPRIRHALHTTRERFELALISAGGVNEADGEAAGGGPERYRFSRCRRPLPAALMEKLGVPLPEGERTVLHDDLAWEEIQVGLGGFCRGKGKGVCESAAALPSSSPLCRLGATPRCPSMRCGSGQLTCRLLHSTSPAVGRQRRELARRDVLACTHPLCAAGKCFCKC